VNGLDIPGIVWRRDPAAEIVPLVFDSPHSGALYPADFAYRCPLSVLRRAEDTYVDELYAAAPDAGATLIGAAFPRSYVDPNRAADDLDPALIHGTLPPELTPRPVTRVGLVRRFARPGMPIYDRRLHAGEIVARVERYHAPYHRTLDEACDRLHRQFGRVWHVNCHSMPSHGTREHGDFVLGDRDGTSCAGEFTDFVADFLRGLGYDVRVNEGYKGVEIVRRLGRPEGGRHSLQIEVDRALYMNQRTLEKSPGFARLQADLARLIAALRDFVRARV
jgi:N-formylglutamate amidohydrolase